MIKCRLDKAPLVVLLLLVLSFEVVAGKKKYQQMVSKSHLGISTARNCELELRIESMPLSNNSGAFCVVCSTEIDCAFKTAHSTIIRDKRVFHISWPSSRTPNNIYVLHPTDEAYIYFFENVYHYKPESMRVYDLVHHVEVLVKQYEHVLGHQIVEKLAHYQGRTVLLPVPVWFGYTGMDVGGLRLPLVTLESDIAFEFTDDDGSFSLSWQLSEHGLPQLFSFAFPFENNTKITLLFSGKGELQSVSGKLGTQDDLVTQLVSEPVAAMPTPSTVVPKASITVAHHHSRFFRPFLGRIRE